MSEYEHNLPASDDPEWMGLVLDVENRFEVLNEALADLRSAVIRLSSYRPQPQVIAEQAEPSQETTEAAAALDDAVRAFEAAAALPETPVEEPDAAIVEAAPTANGATIEEAPPAADDAARREEVSRMVAEARQEHQEHQVTTLHGFDGSWAEQHDDSEVDSTSEGSWPMARPMGVPIQPPGLRHLPDEASKPAAGLGEFVDSEPDVSEEEEARRQEVARVVAELRGGESVGSEVIATEFQADEPGPDDSSSEVSQVESGLERAEAEASGEADEETRREEVARMVAEMRARDSAGGEHEGATVAGEESSDVDVRDEVRRAVEAARAEMASGWVKTDEGETAAAGDAKKFSFPDWQNAHMEPSGPPVIVIKDPEGRVELARVYETLSQVHCDENAALLNYTPHSVTVGLNTRASVPTTEAMEQAIQTVFGRKCRVESDGVRVSVEIGKEPRGNEDAA